jgi:hypothetical protein
MRWSRFVVSQVPKSEAVKCMDILYSLSPDILYTCGQYGSGFAGWRVAQVPGEVSTTTEDGCPRCLAVKCRDMVYSLSPDILYSFPMQG